MYKLPFIATTPTRRANKERVMQSSFNEKIIENNVQFLHQIRSNTSIDMYVGGLMGCKGDAYHQKALMGYCLAKEYWSNGYMTKAVKAVIKYMLFDIGLNRIEATHSVENVASGRVLEKAGMILEGHAKDYYYRNSGFQDSNLYAITKKL